MPSGHGPMGGYQFSDKIMLKQKIERDDDSKKSHPLYAETVASPRGMTCGRPCSSIAT